MYLTQLSASGGPSLLCRYLIETLRVARSDGLSAIIVNGGSILSPTSAIRRQIFRLLYYPHPQNVKDSHHARSQCAHQQCHSSSRRWHAGSVPRDELQTVVRYWGIR